MTSLSSGPHSPDIDALFEAERDIFPESDGCRDRVIGRARAALATGAAWERSRAARRHWVGKAAAAAVALFALCAAAFELGHRLNHQLPAQPAPAPTEPAAAPAEPVATASPPTLVVDEPVADDTVPHRRAHLAPSAQPMTDSDAYAAELRLLRPAQQAVGRHAFVKALGLVMEHQRRFPTGQLAEEREALRVKALIGLERWAEARNAAASFREQFPHSAVLGRIEALLGSQR